jgi:hypothetical protein
VKAQRFLSLTLLTCLPLAASPVYLDHQGSIRFESDGINYSTRGEQTVNTWKQSGRLLISIDKNTFAANESVGITFRVQNRGHRVLTIYPGREIRKTFRLNLRTADYRTVARKDEPAMEKFQGRFYQGRTQAAQPANLRAITLYPGESYSRKINIADIYRLEAGKKYYVRAYFYPDIQNSPTVFSRSENMLSFSLEDKTDFFDTPLHEQRPIAQASGISPSETIYLLLTAEFKRNWPNYLKYLDLPEYIRAYSTFARRYMESPGHKRPTILQEFKRFLIRDPVHPLVKFKITDSREKVPGRTWEVVVDVERDNNRFPLRYTYRYLLERDPASQLYRVTYLTVKAR